MRNLQANGERLWASLMELARIGATDKGGVCRLAATDLDAEARRLFIGWCEAAGCTVKVDQIGNIFARRAGRKPEHPPIMVGSHLDTQPTGGKFDGAYGVLAGLEIVRTLNDLGYETEAPVEIVAWTNEEGSRFSPAMVGSGAFAGVFDLGYGLDRPDNVTGERRSAPNCSASASPGRNPSAAARSQPISRRISSRDRSSKRPGCRSASSPAPKASAGTRSPSPGRRRMPGRHRCRGGATRWSGAARMIDAVNRIGHAHAPHACATVGFVQVSPNSRNTIPGRVFFTVDFRHPVDAVLTAMDRELRAACAEAAATQNLDAQVEEFWYFPPTPFDPALVAAVREAAAAQGYPHQDILSGAGHDAVYLARVAPAAMVFVPCVGGISHNEIEDAKPEDLTAGCNVLLNAVLDRANNASPAEGGAS